MSLSGTPKTVSGLLFATRVTSASLAKSTRMSNFSLKVAKYGSSSSTTELTGFEDVSNTADISDQCLLVKISKWSYGYNKENDIIVISKTGQIGDIYQIQNLKIALPKTPAKIDKSNDKWVVEELPKELKRIQSVFEWRDHPDDFKEKWEPYIDVLKQVTNTLKTVLKIMGW